MSRQRVSKGQLIIKKEEKFTDIVKKLPQGYSDDEFIDAFKKAYPEDWSKINKRYEEHERLTKPGKSHPMPEPSKYLKNALKIFQKKSII